MCASGNSSLRNPTPGILRSESPGAGEHVEYLDLEQVARLGAVYVNGTRERMHSADLDGGDVGRGGARDELAVGPFSCFEDDLIARAARQHRLHPGVPAVVALVRLPGEGHVVVDPDLVYGHEEGLQRTELLRGLARPRGTRSSLVGGYAD